MNEIIELNRLQESAIDAELKIGEIDFSILKNDLYSFILLWIEKEGFVSDEILASNIGLNLETVKKAIVTLFKNRLIDIENNYYCINKRGLLLSDKYNFPEMIMDSYFNTDQMNGKEKELFIELYSTYRSTYVFDYSTTLYKCNSAMKFDKGRNTQNTKSNLPIVVYLIDILDTLRNSKRTEVYDLASSFYLYIDYVRKTSCLSNLVLFEEKRYKEALSNEEIWDYKYFFKKSYYSKIFEKNYRNQFYKLFSNNLKVQNSINKDNLRFEESIMKLIQNGDIAKYCSETGNSEFDLKMSLLDIRNRIDNILNIL
ncbi:hypothetical protein Cpap_0075 [Ruminiclostridium papyrosolvens DSM 2782]|uniref:Uncharacterized protein n=1 Tax=Ruminiclostridium papyrosolvens DSM 2782 TaxID=588581 RepID=F1TIP8_9FIRM|nr:hypothetical protein [Ruminiclostridium papyrosolvens]EGD45747.1 hypothetical protein Cpap_0075 [Ruminiclostridium papyrosolvens DSM 2782]WES35334.1 hypothetical protein P0092_04980 [Ruminiclostridium papyrosolvens DSM 2782]